MVCDVVKVLLVQARDALHISLVALPDAGCQSSKRGLLCKGPRVTAGQAGQCSHPQECRPTVQEQGSRAGPVTITRVGLNPAVARQVHKGKAGLKSSYEFKSLGQGRRVDGQAQAYLQCSSSKDKGPAFKSGSQALSQVSPGGRPLMRLHTDLTQLVLQQPNPNVQLRISELAMGPGSQSPCWGEAGKVVEPVGALCLWHRGGP